MLCMRRILPFILLSVWFAATHAQAQIAPEPPLRVGIVGLVHGHVKGFLEQSLDSQEIEIVGIAEPDQKVSARYAEQYGLNPNLLYTDLEKMLLKTHPQAVLVYTNTFDHRRVVEICAAGGGCGEGSGDA